MRIERSIDMEPDNFEELETKGIELSKKIVSENYNILQAAWHIDDIFSFWLI